MSTEASTQPTIVTVVRVSIAVVSLYDKKKRGWRDKVATKEYDIHSTYWIFSSRLVPAILFLCFVGWLPRWRNLAFGASRPPAFPLFQTARKLQSFFCYIFPSTRRFWLVYETYVRHIRNYKAKKLKKSTNEYLGHVWAVAFSPMQKISLHFVFSTRCRYRED